MRAFRRLEALEAAPDLMGFRRGPKLAPPTRRERHKIRLKRSERRFFGLNPSALLVRRLMRDHSRRSVISQLVGIRVTRLEERELNFQDRIEDALREVDRYTSRCARGT